MTTIKSHSDLQQSKKLAEILPLESADMCLTFVNNIWNPVWGKADDIYQLQKDCYEPDYTKDEYVDIDEFEPKVVPCWSLVALLNILPHPSLHKTFSGWRCDSYNKEGTSCILGETTDNPVDACVAMIEKLHELKLL